MAMLMRLLLGNGQVERLLLRNEQVRACDLFNFIIFNVINSMLCRSLHKFGVNLIPGLSNNITPLASKVILFSVIENYCR